MAADLIADMREIMTANEIEPSTVEKIIDELAASWEGINVYFSKRHAEKSKKLHADILHDYKNGMTVNQLVVKHGVSQVVIYKVIKEKK